MGQRPRHGGEPHAHVDAAAAGQRRDAALKSRHHPVAVPLHLVQPAPAPRQPVGGGRQHRRVAGRRRPGDLLRRVALLDHEPVLLVPAHVGRHQRPQPLQPLPGQAYREAAVALALDQLVAAVVPDLHRAGAVLALGDHAGEGGVLHRVVLGVHGQVALTDLERQALGQRPAGQHAVHLQPQVVVQAPRVVSLHHEHRPPALRRLRLATRRLGRPPGRRLRRYSSSDISGSGRSRRDGRRLGCRRTGRRAARPAACRVAGRPACPRRARPPAAAGRSAGAACWRRRRPGRCG